MMKILMTLSIVILIGLSLFSCDPEETFYFHYYAVVVNNDSNKEIKLIHYELLAYLQKEGYSEKKHILTLLPGTHDNNFIGNITVSSDRNRHILEKIIKIRVDDLRKDTLNDYEKFELYEGEQYIKEWRGNIDMSKDDKLNSPYNYDSWEAVTYDQVLNPSYGKFIYGEIIFTITDADLIIEEEEL